MFCFGPGTGESIAVRVQNKDVVQWMVVDSTRTLGSLATATNPVIELLDHYSENDDPQIRYLVITHRHADHIRAVGRILSYMRAVRVDDQQLIVADSFERVGGPPLVRQDSKSDVLDFSGLDDLAVLRLAVECPKVWTVQIGTQTCATLPLVDASINILHPLDVAKLEHIPAQNANQHSIVLEVVWNGMRICLPGDATRAVFGAIPHSGNHTLGKVPHHGSRGSFHDHWTDGAADRAWMCTPYAASGLPQSGVNSQSDPPSPNMLDHVDEVMLTALPVKHSFRLTTPETLSREEYQRLLDERADGMEYAAPEDNSAWFDAMWFVRLDDNGGQESGRGRSTVLLRQ